MGMFRPGVAPPKEYGIIETGMLISYLSLLWLMETWLRSSCILSDSLLGVEMCRCFICLTSFRKVEYFRVLRLWIQKVPANDSEALRSSLMGLFEKKRCRAFIVCASIDFNDVKTWKEFDLNKVQMREVFKEIQAWGQHYWLLGHAVALHMMTSTWPASCWHSQEIQLYVESLGKYGDSRPLSHLLDLVDSQNLSQTLRNPWRHFMLNTKVDEILLAATGKLRNQEWRRNCKSSHSSSATPAMLCISKKLNNWQSNKSNMYNGPHNSNTNDAASIQIILP